MIEEKTTLVKAYPLQIMPDGRAIFPQEFMNQLDLNLNNSMLLFQIGDLALLVYRPPQVMALTQTFTALMENEGVSLDILLDSLQEERINLWKECQDNG